MRPVVVCALLMGASWVHADHAILVGVGKYPALSRAAPLEGPVPDAKAMEAVLKARGFKTTMLLDEKATRQAILDAIDRVAKVSRPRERFVFFFAGHGTRTPKASILPFDARRAQNAIIAEDLRDQVLKVPAMSRTVILDACFAGGMTKSVGLVSRFYEPENVTKNLGYTDEAEKELFEAPKTGKDICYVAAALQTQEALEYRFSSDERRGLFTYFLVNELKSGQKPWGQVVRDVGTKIQDVLQKYKRQQNPLVSPAFQTIGALQPGTGTARVAPIAPPEDVQKLLNTSMRDPAKLRLFTDPRDAGIPVGQRFTLNAEVNEKGFLVIVGDRDGKLTRLYPKGAEPVPVEPKDTPFVAVVSDALGTETAKAFLFKSANAARAVMDVIPDGDSPPLADLKKALRRDDEEPWEILTAMVAIESQPVLLGDLKLKDMAAFFGKLKEGEALGRLYERALVRADKEWLEDVLANPARQNESSFHFIVNRLITDPRLLGDGSGPVASVEAQKANVAELKRVFVGVFQ